MFYDFQFCNDKLSKQLKLKGLDHGFNRGDQSFSKLEAEIFGLLV